MAGTNLPGGATPAFAAWEHMKMLSDRNRVERFQAAISFCADPAKTLCELGCGSGVFSIYAAKLFRHVIAVDADPSILEIARWNARRHGLEHKIHFIQADALTLTPGQIDACIDVVLSETLSTWLLREHLVPLVNHAHAHLLRAAVPVIPSGITNLLEVGQTAYDFEGIIVRAPAPQLTHITPPVILTPSVPCQRISLGAPTELRQKGSARLPILADGSANMVRLSSFASLAPGISISSCDTTMPELLVPLNRDLTVQLGDLIEVRWDLSFGGGLEQAFFDAELVLS